MQMLQKRIKVTFSYDIHIINHFSKYMSTVTELVEKELKKIQFTTFQQKNFIF